MINMHGAGLAGALMLAVPVLRMAFGANAPDAGDVAVGGFGFLLVAIWARSEPVRRLLGYLWRW